LRLVACSEQSKESPAIAALLELLDLEGALVSLDALGCQKKIVEQIVEGGGDYLVVVKENQGTLYQEIEACFERLAEDGPQGTTSSHYDKVERGHGRQEGRYSLVLEGPEEPSQRQHRPN